MKDGWSAAAAERGISGVITKLDIIDDDLKAATARHGLHVVGSFAAYSDHAGSAMAVPVRPTGRDGGELTPLEWYRGIVPGDPTFDTALAAKLARDLDSSGVETVFLDFLRWPGHWETESRNGGSPRPASFDDGTLARFASWLGVDRIDRVQVSEHAAAWDEFRVHAVNETARRLAEVGHRRGVRVGAFLVPLPHRERRAQYGQDLSDLATHLDLFAVMSYQQIAGLDIGRTLDLTDEVKTKTGRQAVAMLQTSTDPALSGGWDWGPSLAPDTVVARATLLEQARREGRVDAICCFPGEAPIPDFLHAPPLEGIVQ